MLIFYSPTKVHSPTLLHVLVCFLRIFFLLDSDYLNLKLCKVQLRFKSNLKEWWTWTWEGPKTRYHEIVTNDSHVLIRSKSFLSSSSTKTKEICIKTAICNTRNIMTGNGKIKEKIEKWKNTTIPVERQKIKYIVIDLLCAEDMWQLIDLKVENKGHRRIWERWL